MTKKWLSQTPYPPRIPGFYTLTEIHKPTLLGRPIISGKVTEKAVLHLSENSCLKSVVCFL